MQLGVRKKNRKWLVVKEVEGGNARVLFTGNKQEAKKFIANTLGIAQSAIGDLCLGNTFNKM